MSVLKKLFWAPLALMLLCSCNAEKKNIAENPAAMAPEVVIIDVRSAEEFQSGHIKGAINIPHTEIADRIASAVPDKTTPLKLYCRSGRRVKAAINDLQKLDYNNLEDCGGISEAAQRLALPTVQ